MDTNQLKAFVAIAELGSFSLAAQRLCLTQPAISKRIANLEQQLNYLLFERLGRRIDLTEAGKVLIPRAKAILKEVELAHRQLNDLSENIQGELHLTTSHHIGLHRLPAALKQFHQHYAKVQLQLNFLDSESAIKEVTSGNTELALVTIPENLPTTLNSTAIWQDCLKFVVSKEHPLAQEGCPTLLLLSQYPAILPDLNSFTARLIKPLFDQQGLSLDILLASNFMETLRMMVGVGLGWSLLPDTLINTEDFMPLSIKGIDLRRDLGVIHRHDKKLSNPAKALLQILNNGQLF